MVTFFVSITIVQPSLVLSFVDSLFGTTECQDNLIKVKKITTWLMIMIMMVISIIIREGCKKRPFFIVFYYEGVRIFGPFFNVVVDAIGPETDFTLETNVKV